MNRTASLCIAAALLLSSVIPLAGAAVIPISPPINPVLINKERQRNLHKLEEQNGLPKPPPLVKIPASKKKQQPSRGASFMLRGVRVEATPFLTKEDVDRITGRYVGKKADIATLRQIVEDINELLLKERFVTASAYLPPQEIVNGVVHIAILEGRLGKLEVSGSKVLSPSFVRSYVHLQPRQIVDLPRVANDLARFNDTGVARIQAIVRPGAQFGLTDIQLSVTEPPRNQLQVFVDNQGVAAVGRDEIGMLYQLYAPAGIDDQLTIYAVKSEGSLMGSVAYNLPINSSGGRAGISVSSGDIRDVSGIYQPLSISGWSNDVSANAAQPLYVGGNWILLANGSLSYVASRSSELDMTVTSDTAKLETVGFKVGYTDPGFSASVSLNNSFVQSHSDVSGVDTDFDLIGGTFFARGLLPAGFVGVISGSWQKSSQEFIPGSELFQVGGPTTVRGYPSNAAAGPSGYFANFELHHLIRIFGGRSTNRVNLDGFVFLDQGEVFNYYPTSQDLRSVGAGLSWGLDRNLMANVSVGVPVEHSVYGQSTSEVYFSLVAKMF